MRWVDWLLVALAIGSIAVLLVFYGPLCAPREYPSCQTLHYFTEGFVALGLAAAATAAFAVRRVIRPKR
jgi:hypothetical protein